MAPSTLPAATIAKIYKLGQKSPRISNREIASKLGVHNTSVMHYRDGAPKIEVLSESALHDAIRKLLKKSPSTKLEIASKLDVSPRKVATAITEMAARGAMVTETFGKYDIAPSYAAAAGKGVLKAAKSGHGNGEWNHVFGAISDNHLCNKHSRLDVLEEAYDTFARLGITTVYNAGNWIDGEARFNKTELVVSPGMDSQLDYMIDKYPQREGITTHYITGDDHEGWYQQREGVEIGKYLQMRAQDQGRHDLKYLGYGEADIALKNGSGEATMRVVHPGGGSSYAISYTDQKRVESYQGGEKPHVELAGHYHKAIYDYPREVHCVQTGCTCDQTMFMRKKKLQAHVGYWVIKIAQDTRGAITRFSPEWFPKFDLGYYQKRF